jgi:hypothetical protein
VRYGKRWLTDLVSPLTTCCLQIAFQGRLIVPGRWCMSRLPGTLIEKSFLKLHSEYYWKSVFEIHRNRTVVLLALHSLLRPPVR